MVYILVSVAGIQVQTHLRAFKKNQNCSAGEEPKFTMTLLGIVGAHHLVFWSILKPLDHWNQLSFDHICLFTCSLFVSVTAVVSTVQWQLGLCVKLTNLISLKLFKNANCSITKQEVKPEIIQIATWPAEERGMSTRSRCNLSPKTTAGGSKLRSGSFVLGLAGLVFWHLSQEAT